MKLDFIKPLFTINELDPYENKSTMDFWIKMESAADTQFLLKEINNKFPIGFFNLGFRRNFGRSTGTGHINQTFEGLHNYLFFSGLTKKPTEVWLAKDVETQQLVIAAKVFHNQEDTADYTYIITASNYKLTPYDEFNVNGWNAMAQYNWLIDRLLTKEYIIDLTDVID